MSFTWLMFWSRTSEVKENFPKGLNFATVAIDGKAGFDFSMVRLLYEGELKLELSPRRSCWAPLCRVKARTKYPWVHVLSLLGFAAQFLVEDILLGGGHRVVSAPAGTPGTICKVCSRDRKFVLIGFFYFFFFSFPVESKQWLRCPGIVSIQTC